LNEEKVNKLIDLIINAFELKVAANDNWYRDFIQARRLALDLYREANPDWNKSEKEKCTPQE